MREPMWEYERQCIMGANCECNFIGSRPGDGFTCIKFILPLEACVESSARTRQMCVLCHSRLVQSLFYDIIYAGMCTCVFLVGARVYYACFFGCILCFVHAQSSGRKFSSECTFSWQGFPS
jgi:hypothetical protein